MTSLLKIKNLIFLLIILLTTSVFAIDKDNFYRSFWLPNYNGQRLNYCTIDGKFCGLEVANRYCRMLGYLKADQQVIDHNVGLTQFLSLSARCRGWQCNGFKTIRCVTNLKHNPPHPYHYRSKHFAYPRFNNYRVDWCYDGQKGCGQPAAYSFCRRMGYLTNHKFAIQKQISATKALANQKLCFGKECNAFEFINCYR